MASLENRAGNFHVVFRFGGQKYSRSLRTKEKKTAIASVARLEDNLRRLELGNLTLPDGVDLPTFLLSDGMATQKPEKKQGPVNLEQLCQAFLVSIPKAAIEDNSRRGIEIHLRHFKRVLGWRFQIRSLGQGDLQRYVDKRSKQNGLRGNKVSPTTIKKEMTTLTTMWNWAKQLGYVKSEFPKKGLRYPKLVEKPRFQTWQEIERKIERGGLDDNQAAELWDALFLTLPEIDQLLAHVEQRARGSFLYPMFTFAAHTGARRSEMLRSQIDDIDLSAQMATIREKKRVRGKHTTRTVPLSQFF